MTIYVLRCPALPAALRPVADCSCLAAAAASGQQRRRPQLLDEERQLGHLRPHHGHTSVLVRPQDAADAAASQPAAAAPAALPMCVAILPSVFHPHELLATGGVLVRVPATSCTLLRQIIAYVAMLLQRRPLKQKEVSQSLSAPAGPLCYSDATKNQQPCCAPKECNPGPADRGGSGCCALLPAELIVRRV